MTSRRHESASLSASILAASTKGNGATASGIAQHEHAQNWNLLREDLSLPAAVIYQSRLNNNLKWMQDFANSQGVKLAPHGKTTMIPAFFKQQLASGAWALTLATAPQVAAAHHAGVARVIMANQLVGKRNMTIISELLATECAGQPFEFYCLVDSVDNVRQLGEFFSRTQQTLQILIEVGVAGGRCGCRTQEQIADLVDAIRQYPSLKLCGVETYEGLISGERADARIREHLLRVREICSRLRDEGAFKTDSIILTGAGSAWYDLVSEIFSDDALTQPVNGQRIVPVIRPGCYLIHDKGIYLDAQQKVMDRLAGRCDLSGDLQSSLEIWAYVQSIPEPDRAILGLGKRDAAFDAGLPQPQLFYRPGTSQPIEAPREWRVQSIMDQHSMMAIPPGTDLRVGDIIALSTSHPCLTFDKWRQVCVIDDQYNVVEQVETFF